MSPQHTTASPGLLPDEHSSSEFRLDIRSTPYSRTDTVQLIPCIAYAPKEVVLVPVALCVDVKLPAAAVSSE
jgi:hypothetical protein